MKRLFAFLLCLALAVLSACGASHADAPALAEGSHGAAETPIVRTRSAAPAKNAEAEPEGEDKNAAGEDAVTGKEFMDSAFSSVGRLYFREDELAAFRALDQTAEHTFLVQDYFGAQLDPRMEQAEDMTAIFALRDEYVLKTAEEFAGLGCKAEVRRGGAESDSLGTVCLVTAAPDKLWAISDGVGALYLVEEASESLCERFESVVWSSEG